MAITSRRVDRSRLREVRELYAEVREGPFFWAVVWRLSALLALCWLMKG